MSTLIAMPANDAAEQAVLGAILLDNSAYWKIAATLEPADFRQPRHAVIFATMRRLLNQNVPVDLISLYDAGLEKNTESSYLTDIAGSVATAQAIVYHAKIIKQAAHRRTLLTTLERLTQSITNNPADTERQLESSIQSLASCLTADGQIITMQEAMSHTIETLQRLALMPDKLLGLPTGFDSLDKLTGGFQAGQSIVMAAVTKMGKSSVLLHSLLAASQAGHPVALVSLEMGQTQIALRAIAAHSGLPFYRLRRGLVSDGEPWAKTIRSANALGALPFYLVEMGNATMPGILEMGRKLIYQYGVKMLAIDYMGLVQGGLEYKTASENSRLCKIGARDLNIPILALHQLKREVSERPDKRPQLTDLKQTGNIENDADVVLFLYRESYYTNTHNLDDPAELHLAAHRDGPTGMMPIIWHPNTMSFTEGVA